MCSSRLHDPAQEWAGEENKQLNNIYTITHMHLGMTRQGEAGLFIQHISCVGVFQNIKHGIQLIRTNLKDLKEFNLRSLRM